MSLWPGKYVIGLTGNIATGKSMVRKMLEDLGAYGIDADSIAHRAISRNAPGYQSVVETFGKYVLAPDGRIDRLRLGRLVFNDPEALEQLEKIIHPLVGRAIDFLVRHSPKDIVVIEAIKLLESGIARQCDLIWVTFSSQEQQISRLVSDRGITKENALLRINAQPPQEEKMTQADVLIRNDDSVEKTWLQVKSNWDRLISKLEITEHSDLKSQPADTGFTIERARPFQIDEINLFLSRLNHTAPWRTNEDTLAAFGEKAVLLLRLDGRICGMAGWGVENLIACTEEFHFDSEVDLKTALGVLIDEVERISRELQCEISLLFLSADFEAHLNIFSALGYRPRSVESLEAPAWREAAVEKIGNGSIMMFKRLRTDRVMRPI